MLVTCPRTLAPAGIISWPPKNTGSETTASNGSPSRATLVLSPFCNTKCICVPCINSLGGAGWVYCAGAGFAGGGT